MVDFINEVEEELRKDKYNALLRKFGPLIIALIFAVVAGAGYVEYQKYSKSKKARATAASYTKASKLAEEGDFQAAIEKFIAISDIAPRGYAGLSLSRAAGLKVQLGDMDAAVKLFDKSANAFELPIHKDLSSLKAAYILMELGRFDEVKTRTGELALDASPYKDLAKELLAYASMNTGDAETAREQFTYLSNAPGVLSGVKARAKQAMSLLNANVALSPLEVTIEDLPAPEPVIPEQADIQETDAQEIVPNSASQKD